MSNTPKKITNPISFRKINVGGPTHLKLIEDGILDEYGRQEKRKQKKKTTPYVYSTMIQVINALIKDFVEQDEFIYTNKHQRNLKNTLNKELVTLEALRTGHIAFEDLTWMGLKLGEVAMILHYANL